MIRKVLIGAVVASVLAFGTVSAPHVAWAVSGEAMPPKATIPATKAPIITLRIIH